MNPSAIINLKQLANFLRCEEDFLTAYFSGDYVIVDSRLGGIVPSEVVRTSVIEKLYLRKKGGAKTGYREIYTVRTDTLKDTLKTLNTFLVDNYKPPSTVHGYVKGKNIRTNASAHLAKKNLLSVDIANFFESISALRVEKALVDIGFSDFAAQHLSKLATANNFLPPGFNTSPTISNIIVKDMDEQLLKLCGDHCVYTRYADDLYFSSSKDLPKLEELENIIISNGFTLNPGKTKYMKRGGKQYVTGLTVFDHVRPHVTKRIKRSLRLELHYMKKFGQLEHALYRLNYTSQEYEENYMIMSEVDQYIKTADTRIGGWIHFMNSVEPPAAQRLKEKYKSLTLKT
jgi:RNA-directed DNA polymerase